MKAAPDVSVIIPVSRRSDDLEEILAAIRAALASAGRSYETIMVVDGDLPERLEAAQEVAERHEEIQLLRFARGFGEGAALQAGLQAARAPVVLTHPAYFEVDGSVIPRLLEAVDQGADFSFSSRLPASDSAFNRLQRWAFNMLVRRLLGIRSRDVACGVRAFRRQVLDDVSVHGVFHRFITAAAIMQGFEAKEIDAPLHPAARRSRRYSPFTYLRRILDIGNVFFITKFLHKPLRFFGMVGALLLIPGILITGYMTVMRLLGHVALAERPAFLFGIILTVLGFQIFAIGLLGEIISFSQATRKKAYRVREVVRRPAEAKSAANREPSELRGKP